MAEGLGQTITAASDTGAGVARFNAMGRLVWINPALRRRLRLPEGISLVGLMLRDLLAAAPFSPPADVTLLRRLTSESLVIRDIGADSAVCLTFGNDVAESGFCDEDAGAGTAPAGVILTVVDMTGPLTDDRRLKDTLEHMSQGVTLLDGALRLAVWNRRAMELLGMPQDMAYVGRPLADFIRYNAERGEYGPGDPAVLTEERIALARQARAHVFERSRPDGRVLEIRGAPLADGGFVTTYTDVTERKQAERALHELAGTLEVRVSARTQELVRQKHVLETTLESMSEGISVFDQHMRLIVWNPRYKDIFCLPEELVSMGANFEDIICYCAKRGDYGHQEDLTTIVHERTQAAQATSPFSYQFRSSTGQIIESHHKPMSDGGFLRVYRDVTERARTEETQTQLLQAVPVPVIVSRLQDHALLFINQPASQMFGVPVDNLVGRTVIDFYQDPGDRLRLVQRVREEEVVEEFEVALRTAQGEKVWALVAARQFVFQGEAAMLASLTAINERKRMEQELAEQWTITRTVLESISQGLTAFNADLELVAWNRRFFDLLGIPFEFGSYRRPFADFMRFNAMRGEYGDGDVATLVAERVEKARQFVPHRFERERPDGTVIEVEGRSVPGGGFVTTYTDTTERHRDQERVRKAKEQAETALRELQAAQETLIQSEKMAALGSLVAGIAHEINTPIGITLTAASLLQEKISLIGRAFDSGTLRKPEFRTFIANTTEIIDLMLSNIHRAAELIQSFKQVAVDQASEERRTFDLKAYINEVMRSLSVRIRKSSVNIEIEGPEDVLIDSYPGALSQILTNLVINALLHAYRDRDNGTLRIEFNVENNGYISLRFSDDGCGIAEEHRPRIFDPFFTTNRSGGGSGLGLHIVYNLVTRTLHGQIIVESQPGCGTAFILHFPQKVSTAARK